MVGEVRTNKLKGNRTHSVVAVDASGEQLVAANPNRKSVAFYNSGAVVVYLGAQGVTATGANQGFPLPSGSIFTDTDSTEAWYGITASGSAVVNIIDVV